MARRSAPAVIAVGLALALVPAGPAIAAGTDAAPLDDLVVGGSFESPGGDLAVALRGWEPFDADASPTSRAKDGRQAIVLRPRTVGRAAVGPRDDWGLLRATRGVRRAPAVEHVRPRSTYTAQVWAAGTPGQVLRLELIERDDRGRRTGGTTTVARLRADYAPLRVAHRTSADARTLEVAVIGRGPGDPITLDALSVTGDGLPAGNVQPNASFERPDAARGLLVADHTTGWTPFRATVTSTGGDDAVPPPFGGAAAEVRATGGADPALGSAFPGSVARTTAGVLHTGRAWVAGVADPAPGTAGGSTIGRTARIIVREWSPDYRERVRTSERTVVLTGAYQPLQAAVRAARDGDRITVSVSVDGDVAAGGRFRVDGATLTPDVVPAGSVVRDGSFEADAGAWTASVAPGTPSATVTSEPTAPGDPAPVLGERTAVLRAARDARSPWMTMSDEPVPYTYAAGTYTASAWLTGTPSSDGRPATLTLRELRPDGSPAGPPATATVELDARRARRAVVVLRPRASGNRLRLAVGRPSGVRPGESVRVDGVSLTEAPPAYGVAGAGVVDGRLAPPDDGRPMGGSTEGDGGATDAAGAEVATGSVGDDVLPAAPCAWGQDGVAGPPASPRTPRLSAPTFPPGCWRPYSSGSPFNTPAASDWLVDGPDAASSELTRTAPQPIIAGDPSRPEPNPVFHTGPGDRVFTVFCSEPQWSTGCHPEGARDAAGRPRSPFRLRGPATMRPAGPTDAHLTVVDQARHEETDLFAVSSIEDGVIRARAAGRNPGVGTDPLIDPATARAQGDGDGTHVVGSGNAGFSSVAGLIRAQELADGRIDHALAIYVPCAERPVAPADADNVPDLPCRANGMFGGGALHVGQRLQLRMSQAEIAALDAPVWRKAVLVALATYGAYVSDTVPSLCETPGRDGDTYPLRPASGCAAGTREVRSWGFEFEGATTSTALGREDAMARFGRRVGLVAFDEAGDGIAEAPLDLAAGVDWSLLRPTRTEPATSEAPTAVGRRPDR